MLLLVLCKANISPISKNLLISKKIELFKTSSMAIFFTIFSSFSPIVKNLRFFFNKAISSFKTVFSFTVSLNNSKNLFDFYTKNLNKNSLNLERKNLDFFKKFLLNFIIFIFEFFIIFEFFFIILLQKL